MWQQMTTALTETGKKKTAIFYSFFTEVNRHRRISVVVISMLSVIDIRHLQVCQLRKQAVLFDVLICLVGFHCIAVFRLPV